RRGPRPDARGSSRRLPGYRQIGALALSWLVNLGRGHLTPRLYLWICERLYHELAPLYDATAWLVSGGRWWRWTRIAAGGLDGRVGELGPGQGHLLAWLRRRGAHAVGIELSP